MLRRASVCPTPPATSRRTVPMLTAVRVTDLSLRRLLLAGLAASVAACVALPGAAAARQLTHPDGPDCNPVTALELGAPLKSSLSYVVKRGAVPFGFTCDGYYKDGVEYDAGSSKDPSVNPDTRWPADAKYNLKGEITMPAATAHALGLSSRVAGSGRLKPAAPYQDFENSTETDVWMLKLSPAFVGALKRKKVSYIALDFTLDVSLPAFVATYVDEQGTKEIEVPIPASTAHLSNGQSDFKFILDSAWTPKCKSLGKELAMGCPGA